MGPALSLARQGEGIITGSEPSEESLAGVNLTRFTSIGVF